MNWSNVKLIFVREVRDQLRDRRTLFMIAVLPVLLYPLVGMSLFQIAQFRREQPTRIVVVGAAQLPARPRLFAGRHFAPDLFADKDQPQTELVEIDFLAPVAGGGQGTEPPDDAELVEQAIGRLHAGECSAVLHFPRDFASRLEQLQVRMPDRFAAETETEIVAAPSPEIIYSTAKTASSVTAKRIEGALAAWRRQVVAQNLRLANLSPAAAAPFPIASRDVADTSHRNAAAWSNILPFFLLIWALTGAFYPAVDLCAGEKERGTLETLLISPAERSEIVTGKLLTVMLFSVATASLNLLSMGLTGSLVLSQLPELGAPPSWAPLWLLAALAPVSALFSALCLSLAAFARSTKEGQYYLMPLVLVALPLVILPMTPGVELNLGNALIPLTGVMLLLRSALEGDTWQALVYLPPVTIVTLLCCWLAVRWAVDQFSSESVLFRESERLDLGLWLRQLFLERKDTPTVAAGVFCGVLILLVRFVMQSSLREPKSFVDLAILVAVTQLVVIATPALLMTIMFTRNAARTLLLTRSSLRSGLAGAGLAAILACALHPTIVLFGAVVRRLYPMPDELVRRLDSMTAFDAPYWQALLVFALLPAVCEELAFRGFILSGLRHMGHRWRAIVVSALFFGFIHTVVQQSIVAAVFGAVLGYLAVQSGSLLPSVAYHFVHNGLMVVLPAWLAARAAEGAGFAQWLRPGSAAEPLQTYPWPVTITGLLVAAIVLRAFARMRGEPSQEEALERAIRAGAHLGASPEPRPAGREAAG